MKTLKIDNSKIITKNFRGISYIHNAWEYMADDWNRNLTDELIDLQFETIKKMGITMIRSFFGGTLTWDEEKGEHNFESEGALAFYKSCKRFAEIGVEVGISLGWGITGFWMDYTKIIPDYKPGKVNIAVHGGLVMGDLEATAKNFEKFVEGAVNAFERHGIDNITHFFFCTECNNAFQDEPKIFKAKNSYEDREYERLYPIFDCLIRAADQGLKNAGKRDKYKIVAPCDNWRADDGSEPIPYMVKHCVDHLSDVVDIIGSHHGYDRAWTYFDKRGFYDIPEDKLNQPRDLAKSVGKEFFVDEFNVTLHTSYSAVRNLQESNRPLRGVAFGALINKVMNMGDIHTLYIWALYSQQWPNLREGNGIGEFTDGVQQVGYLHNLRDTKIPTYPWYCVSMLTKLLGKGDVYGGDDNGNTFASAMKKANGETAIVVTNYEEEPVDISLDFAKEFDGKTFYKYVYDCHSILPDERLEMIKCSDRIENVKDKLSDTVLKYSVTVYTTEKPE
jgi:hypothetical protein